MKSVPRNLRLSAFMRVRGGPDYKAKAKQVEEAALPELREQTGLPGTMPDVVLEDDTLKSSLGAKLLAAIGKKDETLRESIQDITKAALAMEGTLFKCLQGRPYLWEWELPVVFHGEQFALAQRGLKRDGMTGKKYLSPGGLRSALWGAMKDKGVRV